MKKTILFLILYFNLINVYSQQRYAYLPEGKTFFQTSYQKLIVKYKNGPTKLKEVSKYITDSSLSKVQALEKWNVLDLKNTWRNKDSLISILKSLRNDSDVLYANPFLIYSDGILQGLTNQLIVRLKTSTNIDALLPKFKKLEVISFKESKYIDREYVLTIDAHQQLDALDVANILFETGLFDYCEPDFVKLGVFKTNDPLYNLQWGIHNTGQYNGTPNADINVVNAWNISTGTGIRVAVLDVGVDLNQPDLQANLLPGYDALGLGSNGAPTGDDAHGTACAGIIAAIANNNIGVTGVAYSSRIIPVRVGAGGSITNTTAADGINWAASSTGGNADILSCSWGGGSSSATLNTAIANAINNGRNGKGCIILFSSGDNNASPILYPANQPNVIAVGGTNMCDQRMVTTPTTPVNSCNYDSRLNTVGIYGSSNYGTGLGVVAPGMNIATTDISGTAGFSNRTAEGWIMFNQDYVENFDGTSASCPFTAGVMSLILSVNPNLTYNQATSILESTADKVGGYSYSTNLANGTWNNEMGYGRINACAAVRKALSNKLNISGDALFCITSTPYSISSLPAGTTVAWSATPAGIVTINSPSGTTTTLTKITNGAITLTATISNACGTPIIISKPVQSGDAGISSINLSWLSSCFGNSQLVQLDAVPSTAGTNWQWSVNQGSQFVFTSSTTTPSVQGYVTGSSAILNLNYTGTSCNTPLTGSVTAYTTCNHGLLVSPNPSTGILQLALIDNGTSLNKNTKAMQIKRIRIIDKTGQLKKEIIGNSSNKMTINITDLPTDTYIIQLYDGNTWLSKEIIIKK